MSTLWVTLIVVAFMLVAWVLGIVLGWRARGIYESEYVRAK